MPVTQLHEKFYDLRWRFAQQLPELLEILRQQLNRLDSTRFDPSLLNDIHINLQRLTGTSATFDYPELSAQTRPWCGLIKKMAEWGRPPTVESLIWMRNHLATLSHWSSEYLTRARLPLEAAVHPNVAEAEKLQKERLALLLSRDEKLVSRLILEGANRGCRIERCHSLAELRQAAKERDPTGILVDLDDLEPEEPEQPIIISDRHQPLFTPVPVFSFSSLDAITHRLRAVRLGSTHFTVKPVGVYKVISLLVPWTVIKPLEPYRVLLVDDDTCVIQFHAAILESAGMTTEQVSNPFLVLEAIERFQPELLVLDLYMPNCNGIELAALVRQHEAYASLPILFLSAEQNLGRRLSDQNLAHDDFLIKPIRPTAFIRAILSRIKQARVQRSVSDHLHSALRDLENLQHAINQHAIISATDIQGRITFVNDKFCEISGYSPKELIGQNHRIIKSGYHPPALFQELWATILAGKIWHGQVKNRRKDGSTYWVAATIVPFLDEEAGKPVEFISIRTDITRQKEAEEQARSMAMFAEMNPSPVMRADTIGHILEANPAARALMGIDSDHTGHLADLLPEMAQIDLAAVIRNRKTVQFVTRLNQRFFHFTLHGVADLGVGHLYATDITDLRQAQKELESAKEYAENLIQSSLDMIIAVDPERRIIEFNHAAERCFGYQKQEVLGQHIDILYGDRNLLTRPRNVTSSTGEFKGEVVNQRKDGTSFYSYLASSPLWDKEGHCIGYMGISRDITERKVALEVLRESEERTRAIVESAVEAIILANERGQIELFNPAAERIFGYSSQQMLGRNLSVLMPSPHSDQHDAYIQHYLTTNESRIIGIGQEVAGLRQNGSQVPLFLSVSEFRLGGRRMFAGVLSDITARKQAENDLLAAKETAEKANRAKSEFLSSMSHELRTPMNAVLGFAQLLESDPMEPLSESQNDSIREIMKAGNHLLELINEVLDLAKIEAGKIQITLEDVALRDVIDECLNLVASMAKRRHITLVRCHHLLDCDNYLVRGDRIRIKQVLLNLLSNAIKYNVEQGKVTICCVPGAEGRIRINIIDTGVGIAKGQLTAAFEPFNRLNAERSGVEGTGIGLVIAKRLVEYMGGEIGIASEIGVGSTFWIELVIAAVMDPGDAMDAISRTNNPQHLGPKGKATTILYVEDTPANVKLVERILQRREREFTLITAHTPELGFELVRARRPEIILLDINLPGMDGYEFFKLLQANPLSARIPVIGISANAMPDDIRRGEAVGFFRYLTKPIHVNHLIEALEAARESIP